MKFLSSMLIVLCINTLPLTHAMQPNIPAPIWGRMNAKPSQDWWKTAPNKTILREDFFTDIVYMNEHDYRKKYHFNEGYLEFDKPNRPKSKEWVKERRTAIFQGTFKAYSIEDLDRLIKGKKALTAHPSFSIVVRDPWAPWETDIRYLQSNQKNAVFQLASTPKGPLEGGMAHKTARLTDMLAHAVQGEEASISTAGATIWRKYVMGEPLDLRADFDATNNYKKIKLGLHSDIVVTSGYGDRRDTPNGRQQQLPILNNPNGTVDTARTQIVTHVLTYASIFPKERSPEKAQQLLQAAYEGTLKAAVIAGNPRIFLTLVGGGAFRNDIQWIANALSSKECVDTIKKYGLQVTVIFHPDSKGRRDAVRTAATDILFFQQIINTYAHLIGIRENDSLTQLIQNYLNGAYGNASDDKLHTYAQEINHILMAPARTNKTAQSMPAAHSEAAPAAAQSARAPSVASSSTVQPIAPMQQERKTCGALWKFFDPGNLIPLKHFPADNFYLFRWNSVHKNWTFTEAGTSTQPCAIENTSYSLVIKEKKDLSKPSASGYAWVSETILKNHLQTGSDLISRGNQKIDLDPKLAIMLDSLL